MTMTNTKIYLPLQILDYLSNIVLKLNDIYPAIQNKGDFQMMRCKFLETVNQLVVKFSGKGDNIDQLWKWLKLLTLIVFEPV